MSILDSNLKTFGIFSNFCFLFNFDAEINIFSKVIFKTLFYYLYLLVRAYLIFIRFPGANPINKIYIIEVRPF